MRATRIRRDGDSVVAAVPPESSAGSFVGAAAAILGWLVVLLPVFITLFLRSALDQPDSPMLAVFWLPAVGFVPLFLLGVWAVAWMVGGRETIEIAPDVLAVSRSAFGVPLTRREFDRSSVVRPRVSPRPYVTRSNVWRAFLGGKLAFDYGAATYRVGGGLTDVEAAQLAVDLGGPG